MPTRKQQKQNNKTRRIKVGGDDQRKCMDTMCNEKKFEDFHKKTMIVFEKEIKDIEKKLKEKDITPEKRKNLEQDIKIQKDFVKNMNNSTRKKNTMKILKSSCERQFCNRECLGTIFEEGDINKLPKEMLKKFKGNKQLIEILVKDRQKIFGKKSSVLKDSFYEGLTPKNVDKLKKKGAISGCVKMVSNSA